MVLVMAIQAAWAAGGRAAEALSSPRAEVVERTREHLRDHIYGGWAGMLIGGIEGLAHEFKYTEEPRASLPDYPLLPQGARSDDDNDIEWVHLYFMDKEGALKLPYARLAEIWKANMNQGVWCANEQARKLMNEGVAPPDTSDPGRNSFSAYNLAGQFTVESYGMIAPGMPRTAAELGLHYARISVSGEPLQAARYWTTLVSLAAVREGAIEHLLRAALAAVDPGSAHAEAVRDALDQFQAHPRDWKAARQHFHAKWFLKAPKTAPGKWNDNSTPLNGAMVALALLYGAGDFYRTGQYAMALGYDADCNAATACAVVGTRVGFAAIAKLPNFQMPDRYVNRTRPQLPGECRISDQVDVLVRLAERVILANGGEAISVDGKAGFRIHLQRPALLPSK
jgi:hypothetical protein